MNLEAVTPSEKSLQQKNGMNPFCRSEICSFHKSNFYELLIMKYSVTRLFLDFYSIPGQADENVFWNKMDSSYCFSEYKEFISAI